MLRRLCVAALWVSFLSTSTWAQTLSLFDGKTLRGFDADTQYWRVENGAIVGEIAKGTSLNKNTWLVWNDGKLDDFELRTQFKLTGGEGANSGIQIRCQVTNVDHVSGYQADLDMGQIWLGRIYDEHGRALLVERGSRVRIAPDGAKQTEAFAASRSYQVLFRENDWNEYRIVAVGDRIDVYVNGTLFSQLQDQQDGEQERSGALAFQLHSGGETRIEFRNIELERLEPSDASRLAPFAFREQKPVDQSSVGSLPRVDDKELNLSFERGSLADWTATGDAFEGQPVKQDAIDQRWPGQKSNKVGDFFVGGFELKGDRATGSLTSKPFVLTQPYASFLIGGGSEAATRVEIVSLADDGQERVIFQASGDNRESMRRVAADLSKHVGSQVLVRVVDEHQGGWGHINFDDFRLHETPPVSAEPATAWRSTFNPILQHLVPNPVAKGTTERGADTMEQMHVPAGFSVDVIAAEPNLHQPMAFTFDAKGRLWVVEGYSYPQKRPQGEGLDRILILADQDNDGVFESRSVFAEGLNLVSGMEVGHGGVWVGAAPELLFIPDRDGDDRPDGPPQVLLDGFGYADTHETLNSFMWGPDGWLYGNQGVFNTSAIGKPGAPESERQSLSAGVWRYHPTRHRFEVFAHGGSNQWGLDFDEHGQIFMTHCRSYWGQGGTTHVMQGGHFWNQVNGGYARFISPQPLPGIPTMKNYLLASARYDHGEGGAGKPGTGEVYGGHSHVGTMIYLGDNWPAEYRNHLFSHNLHGHQINHQINRRDAGGYNTVHAGSDVLFCSDPQFIGVDLQVGPDGAVYMSDWYDPRHCHNPNTELWDRGNGRLYRMKYDAKYRPVSVDYEHATELELVAALRHPNDWHARTAQLVLADRAARAQQRSRETKEALVKLATAEPKETLRLRGLWVLHVMGMLDERIVMLAMNDSSEYVRGWVIQLACESHPSSRLSDRMIEMAAKDSSLLVKRYLASAIPRLPEDAAWKIAETLVEQSENASDRDLPLLLWHGLAPLAEADWDRALRLIDRVRIPAIQDYLLWYAAKTSELGRQELATRLTRASGRDQARLLNLFSYALAGSRGLPAPDAWKSISAKLYATNDREVRRAAESLGAAFADPVLFARMRQILKSGKESVPDQEHALTLLALDSDPENLELLLGLLDSQELAPRALPLLRRFDQTRVAEQVLQRLSNWKGTTSSMAMELLSSRPAWAELVLDAIANAKLAKEQLTAYHARQMASLGDEKLNARLAKEWGNIGQSSEQLKEEIRKTTNAYKTAPLWAYSAEEGASHFKRLCSNCHQPATANLEFAPKLEGTGAKGIDYIIENVIDPNAVIGRDYQARVVLTQDGQVVTGLVQSETETSITIKTATDTVTVQKDDIEQSRVSENSFMPIGLLETLNERERIELFKYLMSL